MSVSSEQGGEVVLEGRSIAPGIGFGLAWVERLPRNVAKAHILLSAVDSEKERLHQALRVVGGHIRQRIQATPSDQDEAIHQILKVHEMMLNDPVTVDRIESKISGNAHAESVSHTGDTCPPGQRYRFRN